MNFFNLCRFTLLLISSHLASSNNALKNIDRIECPLPGEDPAPLNPGSIVLEVSNAGYLCMLFCLTTPSSGKETISSISRSYDGNDWETTAGGNNISWLCSDSSVEIIGSVRKCSTDTPQLASNQVFQLVGFYHSLNEKQTVSRFLTQATFGPTLNEINSLSSNNFANWIRQQIAEDATSHRQYYRERVNKREFDIEAIGRPKHPCEESSRWRDYAFTEDDRKRDLSVEVSDRLPSGQNRLSVDGYVRTDVDAGTISPGKYKLCKVIEHQGGVVKIKVNGKCEKLAGGNPPVRLVAHTEVTLPTVLQLPAGISFTKVHNIFGSSSKAYLLQDPLTEMMCDNISFIEDESVFIQTEHGHWLLYDARLVLQGNTIDNPLLDGGGDITLIGSNCANVRQTFLNSESCKLSTTVSACEPEKIAEVYNKNEGVLVCGSPGEVANKPALGTGFDLVIKTKTDTTKREQLEQQRRTIWTTIMLKAPDQLRQRMAWAISQIFSISPGSIDRNTLTEPFVTYYDIFVRNAFGNYLDILKEVSYSPMMAEMLSSLNSKSSAYIWVKSNIKDIFPDENFAREIMQLFTIGSVKLKINGLPEVDPQGNPIEVYDNEDIMSFARAWTGFSRQNARGNIECYKRINMVDPLKISPKWRDLFPKRNLQGGYIGDGYPLCTDMPEKMFLRKGATYSLLGSSPSPKLQEDPSEWNNDDTIIRVTLDESSELYAVLCNSGKRKEDGCDFKTQVVLETNLYCTYGTVECKVDTVRVVQVGSIFYEYIRPPCVELSFYNGGKKISTWKKDVSMCANPNTISASEACCPMDKKRRAFRDCEFTGERMTYKKAEQRCRANVQRMCDFKRIKRDNCVCCKFMGYHWTDARCDVKVKVDKTGKVAIIHIPDATDDDDVRSYVQRGTKNMFSVNWNHGVFPSNLNNCLNFVCEKTFEGDCVCSTTVEYSAVFSSKPHRDDVLAELHIGSMPPDVFSVFMYTADDGSDGVTVHSRTGETFYDIGTIFEVMNAYGQTMYLKNKASTVNIVDNSGEAVASFRNPPQFMNLIEADVRDAQYETDAVLDNYFFHPNTAPFIATLLIKRFQVSNPSPRYTEQVATAFRDGVYFTSQQKFGSGKYGDLEATIMAILLDRESRSVVLDADPMHGALREPMVKLIHFMRAMDFQANTKYSEVFMHDLRNKIGQEPFESRSVFSFFSPQYSPPGVVNAASIVAPEAQVLTTTTITGLLNGMFSLVKYGLSVCDLGFGPMMNCYPDNTCNKCFEGRYDNSMGSFLYSSTSRGAENDIDNLDLLLTNGRLNEEARIIITRAYNNAEAIGKSGLRVAQQLFATLPEFHSTNLVNLSEPREPTALTAASSKPYKAVIYFLMEGGCDSWNMVIPMNCASKDMYAEYKKARGGLALDKYKDDLKPINSPPGTQLCDTFGLHPQLSELQNLYDSGDATILFNTGVLTKQVTKSNYETEHKPYTRLFAHDAQQNEIQSVDPFNEKHKTGVLGRMADALTRIGYNTGLHTVSKRTESLVGKQGMSPPINFFSPKGTEKFNPNSSYDQFLQDIKMLNRMTKLTSGLFGETWSDSLHHSLTQNEDLYNAMKNSKSSTNFPETDLGAQLEMVSRIMNTYPDRKVDRDFFFISMGGFDTHSDMKVRLDRKFKEINKVLKAFPVEMKKKGLWDSVVMVGTSDFGRTLTENSRQGSDHGWGGHNFLVGGGLKGKKILCEYPGDLTDDGPFNIGRGRMLPSCPWDAIWNGIAEWLGVMDLDDVLPNRKNFPNQLFTEVDMFELGDPKSSMSPTKAPTQRKCKSWCEKNNRSWRAKCNWKICKGCGKCERQSRNRSRKKNALSS